MDKSENKNTSINELGKFGLIEHITRRNKPVNKSTIVGIGDDAAIIDSGRLMTLVSTDLKLILLQWDGNRRIYLALIIPLSDFLMNSRI